MDPEVDEGTTPAVDETPDFDWGAIDEGGQSDTGTPDEGGEPKQNPAWNSLLEKLPAPFHPLATPVLQEWDRGVQQQIKRVREEASRPYQGFQQFVEQKIEPDRLLRAHQLVEQLDSNPVEFLDRLKQALIARGQYQEAAAVQAQQDAVVEQQEEFRDPRVDQLQTQTEQLLQQLQEREEQAARQEAEVRMQAQIMEELSMIESRTGPMPDTIKEELFDRAAVLSQKLNRDVSLVEAYQDLQRLRSVFAQTPRPGTQAPRVAPNSGGSPGPIVDPSATRTVEGRRSAIQDILRRTQP